MWKCEKCFSSLRFGTCFFVFGVENEGKVIEVETIFARMVEDFEIFDVFRRQCRRDTRFETGRRYMGDNGFRKNEYFVRHFCGKVSTRRRGAAPQHDAAGTLESLAKYISL